MFFLFAVLQLITADHSWSHSAGTDKEAVLSDRKWAAAEERSVNSLHQRAESGGFICTSSFSAARWTHSMSCQFQDPTWPPPWPSLQRKRRSWERPSLRLVRALSWCHFLSLTVWLYKWSLLSVCLSTGHLFYSASRGAVLKADQKSEYLNVDELKVAVLRPNWSQLSLGSVWPTEFSKKNSLRMNQVWMKIMGLLYESLVPEFDLWPLLLQTWTTTGSSVRTSSMSCSELLTCLCQDTESERSSRSWPRPATSSPSRTSLRWPQVLSVSCSVVRPICGINALRTVSMSRSDRPRAEEQRGGQDVQEGHQ